MKKICFITTVHGTLQGFVLGFADYIHQHTDWEIHVICNPDEEFRNSLPEHIHYHPFIMKRGVCLDGLTVIPAMARLFKKEKFDIVQYSTPNASFYASIAARIAKIPVRLYCQWGMVYVSMKGIRRRFFKCLEKRVCGWSTHIEPDSFGNLRFAQQERLYPEGKGSVVWNGSTGGICLNRYDISSKPRWRQEVRSQFGIAEDAFVYGFVGRITGDKGMNELFAAFRQIMESNPKARLLLVGDVEKEKSLDLRLLEWARQEPSVIFAGSQSNIHRFYSAMDVFILPSYREGFGSVVIEAEAMEIPIISTDIPGPTEAMRHGLTGLTVPKQDVPALVSAMKRLQQEDDLRETMGKNGRIYVGERFDQQKFYHHTLQDRMKLLGLKKRICFVTTVHGTLEAFVLKLADYLHEHQDYDVSFICNPNEAFSKALPQYIHFYPVPMERGFSMGFVKAVRDIKRVFKREKFDLVQYSTPNASFYAALAAKSAKIPVRLYCQWGIAYVGFRGVRRWILKQIEKHVCRCSTWIEPDSHGNLNFSHKEKLYTPEKSSVIWNGSASGVDLKKFDITRKEIWRRRIREKYNISENTYVYGFVGRITGDKGINELLMAFQKILRQKADSCLMLVGNMEKSESVQESLYNWAKQEPRVLFCGGTDNVEQYLSAMDVYILPSYREGFGSVVIEAESMGVPVIVSDIPGPTNAMLRDKTGLVVPKADVQALLEAMETLGANPELCRTYSTAGRKFVEECFEQEQLFEYIMKDRQRLLENR